MTIGSMWRGKIGAAPDAVARLREILPRSTPQTYFELLLRTNGGEGELARQPYWFVLDPVETVAEWHHREYSDNFLIFGSNGGGEHIAFDMRKVAPWPVVAIDMIAGDESALVIASDFDEFLELVGVESED